MYYLSAIFTENLMTGSLKLIIHILTL